MRVQTTPSKDIPEEVTEDEYMRRYSALTRLTQRVGTWPVLDLVPADQALSLALWANDIESRRVRGIATVHKAVTFSERR